MFFGPVTQLLRWLNPDDPVLRHLKKRTFGRATPWRERPMRWSMSPILEKRAVTISLITFADVFLRPRPRKWKPKRVNIKGMSVAGPLPSLSDSPRGKIEMGKTVDEDQEPESYVIPKLTVSETPPFIRVQESCSPAIKDIVAQANKMLQTVNMPKGSDEFKRFLQKRWEQTAESMLVQIKKEDQEVDKGLVRKEVFEKCKEEGIPNTYTNFRFNVAVKGAPIGKGIVVRVNPRSGDAFVWQMPGEGQEQHEAKILIVNAKYQNEILARQFLKGERTDGLTAGKRGG